jgi:hypothetical protein
MRAWAWLQAVGDWRARLAWRRVRMWRRRSRRQALRTRLGTLPAPVMRCPTRRKRASFLAATGFGSPARARWQRRAGSRPAPAGPTARAVAGEVTGDRAARQLQAVGDPLRWRWLAPTTRLQPGWTMSSEATASDLVDEQAIVGDKRQRETHSHRHWPVRQRCIEGARRGRDG